MVVTACRQPANKTVKKDSIIVKAALPPINKKDTIVKRVYPLTDSGQLMMHLDSLPKVVFPYESNGQDTQTPTINLSVFKNKKLFHIPFKLIPTALGAGFLDDSDYQDTTFNLVDSVTYKAEWNLVATTPKFIVIDDWGWGVLVTLSYNFDVIDAIHTVTGAGNNHWQIERTSTIYKNLTIVLHHSWSVETERRGHFEYENNDEKWFIDNNGLIKKQPIRHTNKKHK